MSENTKIQWCHHTFNCHRGCTKISEGCRFCYADAQAKRNPNVLGIWGPDGSRVIASENMWKQPLKWNREAQCNCGAAGMGERQCKWCEGGCQRPRVFCASLADIFEDWDGEVHASQGRAHYTSDDGRDMQPNAAFIGCETDGYHYTTLNDVRARLFKLIDATPNLDWLILTKRPENIRKMWVNPGVSDQHFGEYQESPKEEIIRPIEGYPNYCVSNLGFVYSLNGSENCGFCGNKIVDGNPRKKYCNQRCNDRAFKARRRGELHNSSQAMRRLAFDVGEQGHCRVTLYRDGESHRELVHRLVLTAFSRLPVDDEQGCHRDRNPQNNRIDNLRWGTQVDNWKDSKRHGTHRRSNKLTETQVAEIKSRLASGEEYAALGRAFSVSGTQIGNIDKELQWKEQSPYRKNCWIGCSVAEQADADRNIPHLLKCRDLSPVLFLSIEPLIGPVELSAPSLWHGDCLRGPCSHTTGRGETPMIDWLIVGGESGPNARPCHIDWIRSIVHQCKVAGVPCFVKQLGSHSVGSFDDNHAVVTGRLHFSDSKGGDLEEWPEDLKVRQFPNLEQE